MPQDANPPDLDRHGDDGPASPTPTASSRSRWSITDRRLDDRRRGAGAGRAPGRRDARPAWTRGTRATHGALGPDRQGQGVDARRGDGRSSGRSRSCASTCRRSASPMCGNSICQDRRFLARWMPALEDYFHYRNLDVSTLKELCKRWKPEVAKGWVQAGQARGARRHLRVDRRAQVLPRAFHSAGAPAASSRR